MHEKKGGTHMRRGEAAASAAVIGASENALHAIHVAKKAGCRVLAVDGNPDAAGFQEADEAIIADIKDYEKICEIISEKKIDFLLSVPIGQHVTCSAYINEKLGLRGPKYSSARYSADKYAFHNRLSGESLRNIPLVLIDGDRGPDNYPDVYPAIAKPRFGSGSRDVFYIKNKEELHRAYEAIRDRQEEFVIEQAVQGEEYGVDGAVIENVFYMTLARKKILTPLPVRQAVGNVSFVEDKKLLSAIEEYLRKVTDALGYNDCIFHADVIVDKCGNPFVIEISPRPSGHYLSDLFTRLATGVDLTEEFIKFQMGKAYSFQRRTYKKMAIRYFDFENVRILAVPDERTVRAASDHLVQWACRIRPGDFLGKISDGHSIMNRGYFIMEGGSDTELEEQCKKILRLFPCEEE